MRKPGRLSPYLRASVGNPSCWNELIIVDERTGEVIDHVVEYSIRHVVRELPATYPRTRERIEGEFRAYYPARRS